MVSVSLKVNKSLLAGAISALACALCLAAYLSQVNGEVEQARAEALARYGGEQIEVVVANRDIAAGEVVGDSMVDTKLWIADLLPAEAITNRSDVVGKKLGSSVLEGEVLSKKRLYEASSTLDIPLGYTALSVPVRDVQAVGGALEPGMSVDVYATGPSATTLLIENVLVLATSMAQADAYSAPSVSWVTLSVVPGSVAELVAAAQNLELYLTLPNEDPSDNASIQLEYPDAFEAQDPVEMLEEEDALAGAEGPEGIGEPEAPSDDPAEEAVVEGGHDE